MDQKILVVKRNVLPGMPGEHLRRYLRRGVPLLDYLFHRFVFSNQHFSVPDQDDSTALRKCPALKL